MSELRGSIPTDVWPDGNLSGESGTPVIPASGTQSVDQRWGKNYGIAKG